MKTDSIIEYMSAVSDYNSITELNINKFDIVGEIQNVDLNDLEYFPNLQKLTLSNLTLDDDDLTNISKLNNLEVLELFNCEIFVDGFNYLFNE